MRTHVQLEFSGGLSNNRPGIVRKNEFRDCLNVDLDRNGMPSTRLGTKYITDSLGVAYSAHTEGGVAKGFTGLFQFIKDDGTRVVIGTCGTKVVYDSGSALVDITGSLVRTYGARDKTLFIPATSSGSTGIVFGTDNINEPWYWDGVAASATGLTAAVGADTNTPVKARCGVYFRDYMLWFNYAKAADSTRQYYERMMWSTVNNPFDYSNNKSMPIGEANDPIMAVVPFLDFILVLKYRSIHLVVPNLEPLWAGVTADPFRIHTVHPTIGTDSCRSVIRTANEVLFYRKDGWYVYDGRGTNEDSIRKVSKHISLSGINQAYAEDVHAVYLTDKDQVRVWVPEATTNSDSTSDSGARLGIFYSVHPYLVNYYLKAPAFTKNKLVVADSVNTSCSCIVRLEDETETVYLGTSNGRIIVMEQSDYLDLGNPIESYFISAYYDMGNSRNKIYYKQRIYQKTQKCVMDVTQYRELGVVQITDTLDFSSSYNSFPLTLPFTWGSGVYGSKEWQLDGWDRFSSFKYAVNGQGVDGSGNPIGYALQVVRIETDFDYAAF